MRLRTPPGSRAIQGALPASIRLELYADISCARALSDRIGDDAGFTIVPVNLVRQLQSGTLGELSTCTAIVMPPVVGKEMEAAEAIEQLRNALPHVGLYVLARELREISRIMPKLAAAGVDEIFCLDSAADMQAFTDTIRSRLSAPAPETELRLVWKWFKDSSERSLVMHCVRNGFRLDIWSIRTKIFAQCRKTLQNRLALVGLPSPGMLARWGRVLHLQELERRGMKPATAVADLLGFPSANAMLRSRRRLRKALITKGRQSAMFVSLLKA